MNNWVEKIVFALLPLALSGVVYLFHTVEILQEQIAEIKPQAALAREQVKSEIKEDIHTLDKRVAIIESKQ